MTGGGLDMTARKTKRWLSPAALAILVGSLLASPVLAADFYLKAAETAKTMPGGGPTIPMWGYVLCDSTFTPLAGQGVQVPGPRLVVPPGDTTLNIHLLNGLPPLPTGALGTETRNTSLVIPGLLGVMVPTWTDGASGARTLPAQRVRSFSQEILPGGSVTYSWSALRPGTFIYESGTHPGVQVQMGLYGAVTIDAGAGLAYPGVSYSNEGVLIFSEVDPAIHAAVANGSYGTGAYTSTVNYLPRYFFINGAPYPDTLASPVLASPIVPGQNILLRFLNPGEETHVPVLPDLTMTILAQDGYLLPYSRQAYSFILDAGKTFDAIVTPAVAGLHGLFDRRLRLTNNKTTSGGMITFLGSPPAPGGGCPGAVGATLMLAKTGSGTIQFNWGDLLPAPAFYRLYQSFSASDPLFAQQESSSPLSPVTGATGATGPMPSENLVFYLVAADVTTPTPCEGPKR